MGTSVIEVFSLHAREYDAWYSTPHGRVVLEAEASLLDALLPKGVGADIGAGTGAFAELLSEEREIVCLDPSPEMLSLAVGRCSHRVVGVAEYPPLRVGALDFIYMVTVVEFLEDPQLALSAVRPLLREGGAVAVLSIERESPWGRAYAEISRKRLDPVLSVARLYSRREAELLLEGAGFEVVARAATLDYEPLTVPEEQPRLYVNEECAACGVFLLLARPRARGPAEAR